MPEARTVAKAQRAKRQGKSRSTQAGAFVEEEIRHIRTGEHGARPAKQASAAAKHAARTKGRSGRVAAAGKGAGTRAHATH